MKDELEQDRLWRVLQEGAPLPEAPAWFTARTLARLRQEAAVPSPWMKLRRWVLAGGMAMVATTVLIGWQVHLRKVQDDQVTFAALDLLSRGKKPHYQEEAWFSSY